MLRLPTELYNRCRNVLLNCSEFDSHVSLQTLFVTAELHPFRDSLPEASSKSGRVDACLGFLLLKRLSNGQPVFPLLLTALRDRYQVGDGLRDELDRLLEEVQPTSSVQSAHLFICYKRNTDPDEQLALYLYNILTDQGHEVFIDQSMRTGAAWLEEIDQQIRTSDFLVVLLSEESADSEMVQSEIQRAYEYRQLQGRPHILPVRIAYEEMLPYTVSAFLKPLQYIAWNDPDDNQRVAQSILATVTGQPMPSTSFHMSPSISNLLSEDGRPIEDEEALHSPLPAFDPRFLEELEAPGGVVKLRDQFYIERDADIYLKQEIVKLGTTTTIRAPRQTGKTSLLMRGIHHARQRGAKVVPIDLQSFGYDLLDSVDVFLRELAESICHELRLDESDLEKTWRLSTGVQKKLIYYLEDQVLSEFEQPVVIAIDEADSLLHTTFYRDFFGLLRSWHNRRASHYQWENLNIVLVISTEPYLLIDDINQSPFNVGLDLDLPDFTDAQVLELMRQHGWVESEHYLSQFMNLFNGHPYLTRKALYTLVTQSITWPDLAKVAPTDQGPFGDHLRRQHWHLRDQPELQTALRQIIEHKCCPDDRALFRLLRAGLVKGSGDVYTCRCDLYHQYFKEKLI